MTIQRSNKQTGGRFVQGGLVDDFTNRLGWWERRVFPKDSSDVTIILPAKYNMRPDLLAYDLYGKATLQWFVLQYCSVSDITTFVQGLQLTLPTRSRLFGQMLSPATKLNTIVNT